MGKRKQVKVLKGPTQIKRNGGKKKGRFSVEEQTHSLLACILSKITVQTQCIRLGLPLCVELDVRNRTALLLCKEVALFVEIKLEATLNISQDLKWCSVCEDNSTGYMLEKLL